MLLSKEVLLRRCQLLAIARSRQQSIHALVDDRCIATDVGCNHRHARSHRLQEHDAHALASSGRGTEDMSAGKVARQVFIRHIASEDDILPTLALRKFLKTTPQAALPHQKKTPL